MKKIVTVTICIAFSFFSKAQNNIDISNVKNYFAIANALEKNQEPTNELWDAYLNGAFNKIVTSNGFFTAAKLKQYFKIAWMPKLIKKQKGLSFEINHHLLYKKNRAKLEAYIQKLQIQNTTDSIKQQLLPFLPSHLQSAKYLPTQHYVFFGMPEANGMETMIINDLYLAMVCDEVKFGVLSAHEALHSTLQIRYKELIKNTNTPTFPIFMLVSSVAQEGIADLIDKPILQNANFEFSYLFENRATTDVEQLIKKQDSLFTTLNNSNTSKLEWAKLRNEFVKNAGHIPGRYMATIIKQQNLLQDVVGNIEKPSAFYEAYNKAAEKANVIKFSDAAISYLKKIEQEIF